MTYLELYHDLRHIGNIQHFHGYPTYLDPEYLLLSLLLRGTFLVIGTNKALSQYINITRIFPRIKGWGRSYSVYRLP